MFSLFLQKNFMKRYICIFLLTFSPSFLLTQNKIDSLISEIRSAKDKEQRIQLFIDIGEIYQDENIDSSLYYLNKAKKLAHLQNFEHLESITHRNLGILYRKLGKYDKAIESFYTYLKFCQRKNNTKSKAEAYNNIANIYNIQGNYKLALNYYQHALAIDSSIHNKKGVSSCFTNIGSVYEGMGKFKKAIEYYQKALRIDEERQDQMDIAADFINIGIVYSNQGSFTTAIDYYKKALDIYKNRNNKRGLAICYNNIGDLYTQIKGKSDLANQYYKEALQVFEELKDLRGIAYSYGNLGIAYSQVDNYNAALDHFLKALDYFKEMKDKPGESQICYYIAVNYLNLATSQNNKSISDKYLQLSIEYGLNSLNIAKQMDALELKKDATFVLMEVYKAYNNKTKALQYAEQHIKIKDSLFSKEKTQAIQEMETKYQTEKKEQQIKILNKEKALHQSEIRRQRILIFSIVGGLILMTTLVFLIYKRYKEKTRANRLLQEKNIQINQQKEEITTQRDEIEAQRDEISVQRDNIKEQKLVLERIHKELTQSITYAKRIQSAALPTENILDAVIPKRVIFYQPQGIVGGDFYWATKKDSFRIVVAADCTGHGVPGGFMSMLGMTYLNEIINKENIVQPHEILNNLRQYVIEALHQKGQAGTLKDGMDMSICSLDTQNNQLLIAGANNPVFVVKEKSDDDVPERAIVGDKEYLVEIKTDKMPVSISDRMEPFSQQKLPVNNINMIYMASDGFADQFGGANARKYLRKNLKNLLLNIHSKPFKEQAQILEKEFFSWKGEEQQIDDVLVMGFKLNNNEV
jgi:tetratricopeptide (TPR) repeat protein